MYCPFCGHVETKVTDSRLAAEGQQIRRRRECLACGERFTTFETAELVMEELRHLDEVAYVRFASVYRSFQDVEAFHDEIARLRRRPRRDEPAAQLSFLEAAAAAEAKAAKKRES